MQPKRTEPRPAAASLPAVTATASPIPAPTPAVVDPGSVASVPPKRLGLLRELVAQLSVGDDVATPAHADVRTAARLLGWLEGRDGEPTNVTHAGMRLLASASGSDDEAAVFAEATLEHPPLCRIVGAVLLGEWLELRDLAPALVREVGLAATQADRLVPCILAWRNELRARGWTPRRAALHLRTRTAWMTGLSERARDVLARVGVFTTEQVLALDSTVLREHAGCRPETIREFERFRAELAARPAADPPRRKEPKPRATARSRRTAEPAAALPAIDGTVAEPVAVADTPTATAEPLPSIAVLGATARRLVERRGCVSIGAMARECQDPSSPNADPDRLRQLLADYPGVRWLDEQRAWFWIPGLVRNRLLTRLTKVLAATGELSIAELRAALLQDRALGGEVPPTPILAALCEQLDDCTLSSDRTRVRDARAPRRDGVPPSTNGTAAPAAEVPLAARPTIRDDMLVEELARAAGIPVDQLVALALGDVGRPTRARR